MSAEPDRTENPRPQNKMRQPREFTEFAFEGILLDQEQQVRIDSLNAAVQSRADERIIINDDNDKPDREAPRRHNRHHNHMRSDGGAAKQRTVAPDDGQSMDNDRRIGGSDRQGHRGRRSHDSIYDEAYVAKVQEILTPEQFEVFKQNVSNMNPRQKGRLTDLKTGDSPMPRNLDADTQRIRGVN